MSLHPLTRAGYPIVERLWQLYRHDLSEFRGSMPDAEGRFTLGRLPGYLAGGAQGYLIRADDTAPAGFVFVGPGWRMSEFFVVRAARRRGLGASAARSAFSRHPGPWELAFQEENAAAARFWRHIASDVSTHPPREDRRPVPGKPHLPPDTWLSFHPTHPAPAGS